MCYNFSQNNHVTQFLLPESIEHNFLPGMFFMCEHITGCATDFAVSVSRPLDSADAILYLVGVALSMFLCIIC